MISGAAQQHKKRLVPLRKTDDMRRADRKNGRILDEIWKNGKDCYQVKIYDKFVIFELVKISTFSDFLECEFFRNFQNPDFLARGPSQNDRIE